MADDQRSSDGPVASECPNINLVRVNPHEEVGPDERLELMLEEHRGMKKIRKQDSLLHNSRTPLKAFAKSVSSIWNSNQPWLSHSVPRSRRDHKDEADFITSPKKVLDGLVANLGERFYPKVKQDHHKDAPIDSKSSASSSTAALSVENPEAKNGVAGY